jgi:hypothetical protein
VTAPRRFTELAAAAAAALFLLSWAMLHTAWYDEGEIIDIPVYSNYGTAQRMARSPTVTSTWSTRPGRCRRSSCLRC